MDRTELIQHYRTGMADLDDALAGISDEELDRAQEGDEWTARQVVHHLADGEAMSYTRLRRLVADDVPVIQGYDEPTFAKRLHYDRPIETSLAVVRAVREASLELMAVMTPGEWAKTGIHSEHGTYSIDYWLELYAEHVHEHAGQIRRARGRGWTAASVVPACPCPAVRGRPSRRRRTGVGPRSQPGLARNAAGDYSAADSGQVVISGMNGMKRDGARARTGRLPGAGVAESSPGKYLPPASPRQQVTRDAARRHRGTDPAFAWRADTPRRVRLTRRIDATIGRRNERCNASNRGASQLLPSPGSVTSTNAKGMTPCPIGSPHA